MSAGRGARRVFLALPLPAAARQALAERCAFIGRTRHWRAVRADAYHVTVHFFGALEPDALERARQLAHHPRLAAAGAAGCELVGWGRFPARGRARVLHAELGGGGREHVTAVLALARTLVGEAGFAVERRPPHPHVTVARARRGAAPPRPQPQPWPPVPCLLDRLVLFESHPAPSGARYQPLEVQSLAAAVH